MTDTVEIDLKPSLDNRYVQKTEGDNRYVQKTEEISVITVLDDGTVKTYKFYGYEVVV